MKRLPKIAKKALVFEVFKSFILQVGTWKKDNTSTAAPLTPVCSDKYPNC